MSTIFEVRSIAHDGKTHSWGARFSRADAESLLAERTTGDKKEWADKYHKRWWIEAIDNTGIFDFPSKPVPRERFSTEVSEVETEEGTWNTLHVDVLDDSGVVVTSYDRNHISFYRTFEPFRQGDRLYALISSDYTATSVISLDTGETVASEKPHPGGFCPVGFYVPDWWDVNDDSILPGSTHWSDDRKKPDGMFGFVWGCIWGDDRSWKVQYLDLSKIGDGVIGRDDRFGYVELATNPKLDASDFIECNYYNGKCTITFAALAEFDLETGKREPSDFE